MVLSFWYVLKSICHVSALLCISIVILLCTDRIQLLNKSPSKARRGSTQMHYQFENTLCHRHRRQHREPTTRSAHKQLKCMPICMRIYIYPGIFAILDASNLRSSFDRRSSRNTKYAAVALIPDNVRGVVVCADKMAHRPPTNVFFNCPLRMTSTTHITNMMIAKYTGMENSSIKCCHFMQNTMYTLAK